jgi:hypothetical protein
MEAGNEHGCFDREPREICEQNSKSFSRKERGVHAASTRQKKVSRLFAASLIADVEAG